MSHQERLADLKKLAKKSSELHLEMRQLWRDLADLGLDQVVTVGRSADEALRWTAALYDDIHFALNDAGRDPAYFDKLKAN